MKLSATDFFSRFALNPVQGRSRAGRLEVLVAVGMIWLGAFACSRKEAHMADIPDLTPAIATLRDAYSAFNRGNIDAAVEGLDPQIEWIEPVEFPGGGVFHGR